MNRFSCVGLCNHDWANETSTASGTHSCVKSSTPLFMV